MYQRNDKLHFGEGESDFSTTTKYGTLSSAEQVVVTNGKLGLASHNGLHGNGNKKVVLTNLQVQDWEVAGIQLNGADYVAIEDCKIGPNSKQVPALAALSNARFTDLLVSNYIRAAWNER